MRWTRPVFVLLFLTSSPLFAKLKNHTEAYAGAFFANRLLTAGLIANAKNESTLWGQRDKMQILEYGYLKSSLDFFTNAFTTILEPMIELYPVPILGIGGGFQGNYSLADSREISSCGENLHCKGLVRWLYGSVTLQAALGSVLGKLVYQYGSLSHSSDLTTAFLSSSALVSSPSEGSKMQAWFLTAAYKLNEKWTVGSYASQYTVFANQDSSQRLFLFGAYKKNTWEYTLGAGLSKASVFAKYRGWNSESGLSFFFQLLKTVLPI